MSLQLSRRTILALAADILLIWVFAAIGRSSHAETHALLGSPATAWPFWLGMAAGWVAVHRISHRVPVELGPGITVWAATVVLGMLLRMVSGAGTAFSFVILAALVLGIFLLGWRAAYAWWTARRPAGADNREPAPEADVEVS